MNQKSKIALISVLSFLLFLISCYPRRSPFEGAASLPIAPSVYRIMMRCIDDFEIKYPKARINGNREYCRAAVDSLLNGVTEQIVLDRPLTKAESLAFNTKKSKLYVFRIARTPMSFIVNKNNPLVDLDSFQIAEILTGRKTNWNEIVDYENQPIRIYLPQPGEGVWELIQVLFKTPEQIVAEIVDSDSIETRVSQDRYGFGAIVGIASESVKPVGIRFQGAIQRPTLRAVYELRYPWVVPITYITTKDEIDVATSFLNHISSREGQKFLSELNTLPAMIPIIVR
ncbi:MAG: substrate-binding domain-containing protein [bacterium]|nr:substrate-binding domain-containing protein [bacterium]